MHVIASQKPTGIGDFLDLEPYVVFCADHATLRHADVPGVRINYFGFRRKSAVICFGHLALQLYHIPLSDLFGVVRFTTDNTSDDRASEAGSWGGSENSACEIPYSASCERPVELVVHGCIFLVRGIARCWCREMDVAIVDPEIRSCMRSVEGLRSGGGTSARYRESRNGHDSFDASGQTLEQRRAWRRSFDGGYAQI